MYPVLLSNRYLRSRVIPLIAIAAVALCVALVIIVVSVMSGFLEMVKQSGRKLNGDVIISYTVTGIPWYERLHAMLEERPEVAAVAPLVDGWGLLRMPYPDGQEKSMETVQFWAVEPESFDRVTGYMQTLYWRPPTDAERDEMAEHDFRQIVEKSNGTQELEELLERGRRLAVEELDPRTGELREQPGVLLGIHVSRANVRERDGTYRPVRNPLEGFWWMPRFEVILSTLPPRTSITSPQSENVRLRVVNEYRSGLYLIDETRVIVPLEVGQRLMHLDGSEIIGPDGDVVAVEPPRATQLLIRAAPGITPEALQSIANEVYAQFRMELFNDPDVYFPLIPPDVGSGVRIQTWREQQARFIDPVEKERELMRTLFSLIYLVCAGLVLAIFWAIVHEKTRDIGILRSIGASRFGICWIFLRYGFFIGVLGAVCGLGLGWLVVRNINTIHTAMADPPLQLAILAFVVTAIVVTLTVIRARSGRMLPVVLGGTITFTTFGMGLVILFVKYVVGGVMVWDPAVYYFSVIPNQLDPVACVTTMVGAVIFSVLGAFFPAARAADVDPVGALRYE